MYFRTFNILGYKRKLPYFNVVTADTAGDFLFYRVRGY
jgi:hypothetical protein